MWGIHRGPVNSPHKWPITRKVFPFDDVIMGQPWQTTTKHNRLLEMHPVSIKNSSFEYRVFPRHAHRHCSSFGHWWAIRNQYIDKITHSSLSHRQTFPSHWRLGKKYNHFSISVSKLVVLQSLHNECIYFGAIGESGVNLPPGKLMAGMAMRVCWDASSMGKIPRNNYVDKQ